MAGQTKAPQDIHRQQEILTWHELIARGESHTNDSTIDVRFYHLNLDISIDSAYISGEVTCQFTPVADGLDSLFLDLSEALTVTAISPPCESFYQEDDKIRIRLEKSFNAGETIGLTISYAGAPVSPGNLKGLRYETHNGSEPVIATLSTPYLAHFWYPCKDGPEDKADSVYVDLTIEKRTVNNFELLAVSNGILYDTLSAGNKKTFRWKHCYPVVTYYVMAAISNYVVIEDTYTDNDLTFPLEYFVFNETLQSQQEGVEDIPDCIGLFNTLFGTYPFATEKYGMTQLGFYGAIENQTNVIQNTLHPNWFMISVHELAHMWFGDMITCETWHHGWLNEGFATYAEALWVEHENGLAAYHDYMDNQQYFGGGTLYLEDVEDPFEIFIPIIYQKGAWTLHMLRGVVGDSLFFSSLLDYASDTSLRYGHANTEDLQQVVEDAAGLDLDIFFSQWVYDAYYPIYFYNFLQEQDCTLFVSIYQAQEELYGRRPVFEMPVSIHVVFKDDSDTTIRVNNQEQWQQYTFELDKKVESVAIDPDRWILREVYFRDELPVGITGSKRERQVLVYPNPVHGFLLLELPEFTGKKSQFSLFDLSGRKVMSQDIGSSKNRIDMTALAEGIYLYRIGGSGQGNIYSGKIIKH